MAPRDRVTSDETSLKANWKFLRLNFVGISSWRRKFSHFAAGKTRVWLRRRMTMGFYALGNAFNIMLSVKHRAILEYHRTRSSIFQDRPFSETIHFSKTVHFSGPSIFTLENMPPKWTSTFKRIAKPKLKYFRKLGESLMTQPHLDNAFLTTI